MSNHEDYISLNSLRIIFHHKLKIEIYKYRAFYFITVMRKNTEIDVTGSKITIIDSLNIYDE